MARKGTIAQYKDRMSSPIGMVRTDPKTRQPIKKAAVKRKAK